MLICISRAGSCGDERYAMQRRHSSNTDGMPSERLVEYLPETAELLLQIPFCVLTSWTIYNNLKVVHPGHMHTVWGSNVCVLVRLLSSN